MSSNVWGLHLCIWFQVTGLLIICMKFTLIIGEIFMYYKKYTRYYEKEHSSVLLNCHGWQRREREYELHSKELFSNKKIKVIIFSLIYVNNVSYIYIYIYINLILTTLRALCFMPDKFLYISLLKEFDKVNLNSYFKWVLQMKIKKEGNSVDNLLCSRHTRNIVTL